MRRSFLVVAIVLCSIAVAARRAEAQQRPLVTEDPEVIGAGRILLEGGVDVERDVLYTVSGLRGDRISVPTFGVSVGLSSIAEVQLDWGAHQRLDITERRTTAPLTSTITAMLNPAATRMARATALVAVSTSVVSATSATTERGLAWIGLWTTRHGEPHSVQTTAGDPASPDEGAPFSFAPSRPTTRRTATSIALARSPSAVATSTLPAASSVTTSWATATRTPGR